MKRSQKFIVSVPIVPGVTKSRMAAYIKDAVESWSGQFEPPCEQNNYKGDPLFGAFCCKRNPKAGNYRSKVGVTKP